MDALDFGLFHAKPKVQLSLAQGHVWRQDNVQMDLDNATNVLWNGLKTKKLR